MKVKWLGMPNILAEREIVREFLQEDARPAGIAAEVGRLLDDPVCPRGFPGEPAAGYRKALGAPGASGRAAEAILAVAAKRKSAAPRDPEGRRG